MTTRDQQQQLHAAGAPTMRYSEIADRIIAGYPAVPDRPYTPGVSYSIGQAVDVGNVRGPINWSPSDDQIMDEANRLGVVAVTD